MHVRGRAMKLAKNCFTRFADSACVLLTVLNSRMNTSVIGAMSVVAQGGLASGGNQWKRMSGAYVIFGIVGACLPKVTVARNG
jgi:hypothetical protein